MNLEQQRALALARARRRRAEAYNVESQESRDARASASQKSRDFFGDASKQPPLESSRSSSVLDRGALGASVQSSADLVSAGFGDELFGVLASPLELGIGAYSGEDEGKGIIERIGDAYARGRDKSRGLTEEAREQHPVASTVGAIGGGLAMSPRLVARLAGTTAAGAGTAARIGAGVREGAVMGGAYGAGSGEGLEDSVKDAVAGAATGAVIGGAIPAISGAVRGATRPIRNAITARTDPEGYAARKVQERLGASGMSAQQAANRMQAQPGTNLADVAGPSTRGLLRTATNIPGPAQDNVAKQLTLRQMGQGSRIKDSLGRTFADPDSYLTTKDALARQASEAAEPLYRQAYQMPVHYSEPLEAILKTPAGRRALSKASELAGNEQYPFQQIFARELDDGSFSVQRVPDMRGWDYIKRAMDDMIDAQTDSMTRKMTNEGRILTGLKNRLLQHLDTANPYYAQARQAYAGPKAIDEAVELGRTAKTMSPDALRRATSTMTPAQKQAARIGAAEEIRAAVDAAGFTHNAVLKVMSNRQQMQNLRTLFDDDAAFNQFTRELMSEARKRSTYDAVKGNSTTVRQAMDAAEAGGLAETAGLAVTAATSGPFTATMQWIGNSLRRLGGLTPEVANQIARRLTSSNPQNAMGIIQELTRLERQALTAEQKRMGIQAMLSRSLTGSSLAATGRN